MYRERDHVRQPDNGLTFIYHFILTKFAGHSPSLDTFCQQVKTNPAEGGLVSSVVGERQKTTKGDENAQNEPDHYPGN